MGFNSTDKPVAATLTIGGITAAQGTPNTFTSAWPVKLTDGSGTVATFKSLATQVVSTDVGPVVNAVIHGLTTGGGGGYVDVKVNPSGALTVDATIAAAISGVVSVSGTANVAQTGSPWGVSGTVVANQGTASATAWPVFTSQVVSATITGFVSVSNTVTVTGNVSVSNAVLVTGTVSVSGNVGVSGFVTVSGIASVSGTVSLSGTVGVNQGAASSSAGWPVFLGGASAASGYQMYQNTALSNTVVNVKASSGNVYGYHFKNDNDLDCYVQFFKVTAASVTLSSTVAVRTIAVPGGGGIIDSLAGPLAFASGIAIATTVSKSGSTANSSSILAMVDYY